MRSLVIVEWNGRDVPEQLRQLPAGRYVLARVDEALALSPEEEAGLIAALKSGETRFVPHEEVMACARRLLTSAGLDGEADQGAEQAWVEEITRRAERARAGQTAGIDAEAVHSEASRIVEGR